MPAAWRLIPKPTAKLLRPAIVDNIFVQPAASDDGVALGAALAPFLDGGQRLPLKPMRHAYLGPSFDDAAIEAALNTYKIRYTHLSDPAATAAEFLSQGKILGWFQGRMEFGPRALGSRSIIADPRDPEMNTKVNNAVKFREWWRPFAPSFKKEAAPDYLESAYDSPFMILTAQVRPEKRERDSLGHARGWQRASADRRKRNQPALLPPDRRIRQAHRRARYYEHFVQPARGGHRPYAYRCHSDFLQFRHGRSLNRPLPRTEIDQPS